MTTRIDPTQRTDDMTLLHPSARKQYQQLADYLLDAHTRKETRSLFLPFETFRHPLRQRMLFTTTKSTRAKEYQSAHQYGLAVDFVAFKDKWSWNPEEDWDFLRVSAHKFGLLVPYKWDLVHVEHPRFEWLRYDVTRL